jgi:superfamily I DNA/RNA helicase
VPWTLRLPRWPQAQQQLAELVAREISAVGDGRLAMLLPRDRRADWGRYLSTLPGVAAVEGPAGLQSPAVVLTVHQAKGLEFDTVLLIEPGEMLAASANGARDLYVALTRATRRLGILHTGELPEMLSKVAPLAAG